MAHNHDNNQPNPGTHVFAMGYLGNSKQYILIGPNHNNPQNAVALTPPDSLRNLSQVGVLNCVNGYLCFFVYVVHLLTWKLVMWNPINGATEPEVAITPNKGYTRAVVGCGVCPVNGPKIVRISVKDTYDKGRTEWDNRIDVYTVRTGEWRNVEQNMPFMLCDMECAKVCVNGGVIYFRAYDSSQLPMKHTFFISFDFVTEVFGVVHLPRRCSFHPCLTESVKVKESLGLIEHRRGYSHVWTMRERANGTFSWHGGRRFRGSVMAFRRNGKAVMAQVVNVGGRDVRLSVVRPLI